MNFPNTKLTWFDWNKQNAKSPSCIEPGGCGKAIVKRKAWKQWQKECGLFIPEVTKE